MAEHISTQLPLAQQLNDMVKNFTLLDILSKEEQEDLLTSKIDLIRRQNEERLKRHQEIEDDKKAAVSSVGTPKPSGTPLMQSTPTTPSETMNTLPLHDSPGSPYDCARSPNNRAGSPHNHAGSPHNHAGSPHNHAGSPHNHARSPHNRARSPQGTSLQSMQGIYDFINIHLVNEGKGLGFGLVAFKGLAVAVKTIVPGGAADTDGHLKTGDILVYINKTNVSCFSRDEVVDLLIKEQNLSPKIKLQVARAVPKSMPRQSNTASLPNSSGRQMQHTYGANMDKKMEEWSEKRKQNIDRVEAEIQAMREEYENQKQQGISTSPPPVTNNFLDDISRRNPSQSADMVTKQQLSSRRTPHSYGGADFEDASALIVRQHGLHKQGSRNLDNSVTMTGKERKQYEHWKQERNVIDEERLSRHRNDTGEWKREWDKEKEVRSSTQNEWQAGKASPSFGKGHGVAVAGNHNSGQQITTDVPQSWGRGRGRGRGSPKKDQVNQDKFSRLGSANVKKVKMGEQKWESKQTTDSLEKPSHTANATHNTEDGHSGGVALTAGTDHKQQHPKKTLRINVTNHPTEPQDSVTSPGVFKTPTGFKPVINWADEMDKIEGEEGY